MRLPWNSGVPPVETIFEHGYTGAITTKTAAANGLNKQDAKYLALIDKYLAEIKAIQEETARKRVAGGAITRRIDCNLKEIQAIIARVEATL